MGDYKQIIIILLVSALLLGALAALVVMRDGGTPETLLSEDKALNGPLSPKELAVANPDVTNDMNRTAVFNTNKGVFKMELFEDQMPITTANFVKLAESGYYDGTKFHRVIPNFMIQAGDPNSKTENVATYGTGGPGYTIQDEFVSGALLTNARGTIAMANTGQPNSGGSQFFINVVDNTGLDFDKEPLTSKHPVFGRVIEGMDVVDAISSVQTGQRDLPVDAVIIESIKIE